MSRVSYENFGARAASAAHFLEMAGRAKPLAAAEKRILADVMAKLRLEANDDLLEIGCGPGGLLLPLSFFVRSATGVDHPNAIAAFRSRLGTGGPKLIEGNFLDVAIPGAFSKILIYSVVHYLSDERELLRFVDKAVGLLKPGGLLLLGDVPNADKKKRFLRTRKGREVMKAWEKVAASFRGIPGPAMRPDPDLIAIDDRILLSLMTRLRRQGHEAFLLEQPEGLAMCYSREDVLVRRQWA